MNSLKINLTCPRCGNSNWIHREDGFECAACGDFSYTEDMGSVVEQNHIDTLEDRDAELERLWAEFGDVPMDPDTECMEDDFLGFPHGTHREEIWRWFDERYSKGVYHLLYGFGGVDRTSETAQLVHLKQLCTECDSETCIFNPDGICKFPFVRGCAPGLSDDGCSDYAYKENDP